MDPVAPPAKRRRTGLLVALAGTAIAAGALGFFVHQGRQRAALRAHAAAAFDLDAAMALAGGAVPPGVESFYFFVLEPEGDESAELADKMLQAAGEQEFLGIAGADAVHNREVLLAALAIVRPRDLAGLVLVYVGPREQEAELQTEVGASGAQLRFVPYQPAAEAI